MLVVKEHWSRPVPIESNGWQPQAIYGKWDPPQRMRSFRLGIHMIFLCVVGNQIGCSYPGITSGTNSICYKAVFLH